MVEQLLLWAWHKLILGRKVFVLDIVMRDPDHSFLLLLLPPVCWAEESMPISHFLGPQRPTLRMEITALDDIITFDVKVLSQFLSKEGGMAFLLF